VWWRVNAWTEISGLLTSTVLAVGLSFVPEAAWPAAPFNGWAEGAAWDFSGKFLLISALSTVVMVAVTLLTRPVPREQLAAFHAKVQPFGLWGPFRRSGARRPSRVLPLALGWAGGMAVTWGPMLGIGQWLLGRDPAPALLAGAGGGVLLFWSWRRTAVGPEEKAA
jgi:SSS family solute:Na+ symporter